MAFDPSQFGATPAGKGSSFDPSKFGATPVSAPAQVPAAPVNASKSMLGGSGQSSLGSVADGIWSSLANSSVGKTITSAGQDVNAAISGTGQYAGQGALQRGFSAAETVGGTPAKVAADIIPGAGAVSGVIGAGAGSVVNAVGGIGDTLAAGAQKLGLMSPEGLAQYRANNANFANSGAGKKIETAASIGKSAGAIAGTILGAQGAANTLQAGVNLAKPIISGVKDVNAVSDAFKPTPASPDVQKIQDTIAPKLNAAETRTALQEGRLERAPSGGLREWMFGKSPDTVVAAEETQQAAQTIADNIPGAAKMDDAQLYGAMDGKTTELAQQLGGEMQKVQVRPETVDNITSAWQKLREAQIEEPEYDNYPGSAKAQAKFDRYLSPFQEKSFNTEMNSRLGAGQVEPPTLDDVWQARKDYDSSIAANVKNATTASAPTLQWQKTMWLQNRSLLNHAINDTESGLGETSLKSFSDMKDMYSAQQNILSKAKVDVKGTTGQLGHIGKSIAKWGVGLGLGTLGLHELTH